jgi:hypothetical protein
MPKIYNRIQTIANRAVFGGERTAVSEVESLSNYYEGSVNDAMDLLIGIVCGMNDDTFMDLHSPSAAKRAAGALDVLKDYQLLISMIDSNLLSQFDRAKAKG